MIVAQIQILLTMVIFIQLLLKCIDYRFLQAEETEEEGEDEKDETREEEEKQDSEFQDYDVNSDV